MLKVVPPKTVEPRVEGQLKFWTDGVLYPDSGKLLSNVTPRC
jgi:hypothetical protein